MTNTAEVMAQAAVIFSNQSGITAILAYAAAGILGIILSPANQNIIEHWADPIIDQLLKALPLFAQPFKGMIKSKIMVLMPTVFSLALTKLAIVLGVDPKAAATGCLTLIGGTHYVNGTDVAAAGKAALVIMVLGLGLLMPRSLKADFAAWNAGKIGSNLYDFQKDGSWSNAGGGTLLADEFALGWGTTNTDGSFAPYLAILAGAGPEERGGKLFVDLTADVGTQVPGTSGMFVAGVAKNFLTGNVPSLSAALSVAVGQPFKIWK